MARIKIECFENDKDLIKECLADYTGCCPFEKGRGESFCNKVSLGCETCIEENVEFVIKEEKE